MNAVVANPVLPAASSRSRGPRKLNAAAFGLALGLSAIGACSTKPQEIGRSGILGRYELGTLSAQIGPEIGVLPAAAATEVTLEDRGYVLLSRSLTTDNAELVARKADAIVFDKVSVSIYLTATGTGLDIRFGALGDRVPSYALMEAILARLGLVDQQPPASSAPSGSDSGSASTQN